MLLPKDVPALLEIVAEQSFVALLHQVDEENFSYDRANTIREFAQNEALLGDNLEPHSRALRVYFMFLVAVHNFVISKHEIVIPLEADIRAQEDIVQKSEDDVRVSKEEMIKKAAILTSLQKTYQADHENYEAAERRYQLAAKKKDKFTSIINALEVNLKDMNKYVTLVKRKRVTLLGDELLRAFLFLLRGRFPYSYEKDFFNHARSYCKANSIPLSICDDEVLECPFDVACMSCSEDSQAFLKQLISSDISGFIVDPEGILLNPSGKVTNNCKYLSLQDERTLEFVRNPPREIDAAVIDCTLNPSANEITKLVEVLAGNVSDINIFITVRNWDAVNNFASDMVQNSFVLQLETKKTWLEVESYEKATAVKNSSCLITTAQQVKALQSQCKDIIWTIADKYNNLDFIRSGIDPLQSFQKMLGLLTDLQLEISMKLDVINSYSDIEHECREFCEELEMLWESLRKLFFVCPLYQYSLPNFVTRLLSFCKSNMSFRQCLKKILTNILSELLVSHQTLFLSFYLIRRFCRKSNLESNYQKYEKTFEENVSYFQLPSSLLQLQPGYNECSYKVFEDSLKRLDPLSPQMREITLNFKEQKSLIKEVVVFGTFHKVEHYVNRKLSILEKIMIFGALNPYHIRSLVARSIEYISEETVVDNGMFSFVDTSISANESLTSYIVIEKDAEVTNNAIFEGLVRGIHCRFLNLDEIKDPDFFKADKLTSFLKGCFEMNQWLFIHARIWSLKLQRLFNMVTKFIGSLPFEVKLTSSFRVWFYTFEAELNLNSCRVKSLLSLFQNSDLCIQRALSRVYDSFYSFKTYLKECETFSKELTFTCACKYLDLTYHFEHDTKSLREKAASWRDLVIKIIIIHLFRIQQNGSSGHVLSTSGHLFCALRLAAFWVNYNKRLTVSNDEIISLMYSYVYSQDTDMTYEYIGPLCLALSEADRLLVKVDRSESAYEQILNTLKGMRPMLEFRSNFESICSGEKSWRKVCYSSSLFDNFQSNSSDGQLKTARYVTSCLMRSKLDVMDFDLLFHDVDSSLIPLKRQCSLLNTRVKILLVLLDSTIRIMEGKDHTSSLVQSQDLCFELKKNFIVGSHQFGVPWFQLAAASRFYIHAFQYLKETIMSCVAIDSPEEPGLNREVFVNVPFLVDSACFFSDLEMALCSLENKAISDYALVLDFGNPFRNYFSNLYLNGIVAINHEWDPVSHLFREKEDCVPSQAFRAPPASVRLIPRSILSPSFGENHLEETEGSYKVVPVWTHYPQTSNSVSHATQMYSEVFLSNSHCRARIATYALIPCITIGSHLKQENPNVYLVCHSYSHWGP